MVPLQVLKIKQTFQNNLCSNQIQENAQTCKTGLRNQSNYVRNQYGIWGSCFVIIGNLLQSVYIPWDDVLGTIRNLRFGLRNPRARFLTLGILCLFSCKDKVEQYII